MPIVPVTNGSTITTAGIAAMHEAVRGDVNAVLNRYLGRHTFNHVQLDGIGVAAGYYDTKTTNPVEVDMEVADAELTPPDLTTSTLNRVISFSPSIGTLPPCYVLLFAEMEVTGWALQYGIDWARHLAVMALSVSIDGGAQNFPNGLTDQGVCRMRAAGFDGMTSTTNVEEVAQNTRTKMSIASLYDGSGGSSFELSNISLWAAGCEGGSANALETNVADGAIAEGTIFRVPRASVSYLAFRKV